MLFNSFSSSLLNIVSWDTVSITWLSRWSFWWNGHKHIFPLFIGLKMLRKKSLNFVFLFSFPKKRIIELIFFPLSICSLNSFGSSSAHLSLNRNFTLRPWENTLLKSFSSFDRKRFSRILVWSFLILRELCKTWKI